MLSTSTTSRNVRAASHAGSWYIANPTELDAQLTGFLAEVNPSDDPYPIKRCKAIIAPHAGYSYSGRTAAWAYKAIDTTEIKRVFILGPSHKLYLSGCALPDTVEYMTPIGSLPLDLDAIKELQKTNKFVTISREDDENEHSLEMHLPYIRKIFEGKDVKIVPVVVGALSTEKESEYGSILAPFLAREDTFCVVSSDFCHWGTRFSYTYYYPDNESASVRLSGGIAPDPNYSISTSISRLDHEAMEVLTLPPGTARAAQIRFAEYLAETQNTICGRHAIGVIFGAMGALAREGGGGSQCVNWVRYEQSSACVTIKDSSVSYASAWIEY